MRGVRGSEGERGGIGSDPVADGGEAGEPDGDGMADALGRLTGEGCEFSEEMQGKFPSALPSASADTVVFGLVLVGVGREDAVVAADGCGELGSISAEEGILALQGFAQDDGGHSAVGNRENRRRETDLEMRKPGGGGGLFLLELGRSFADVVAAGQEGDPSASCVRVERQA